MKYFYVFIISLVYTFSTQLNAQTTYLWSTGATTPTIDASPTVTTTYYVTITHNGVDYLDSVTVVVNQPSSSEENVTATSSYTWDANGQTYSTSGTYIDTLLNTAGCDSIVTLNLTINEPLQYNLTQSATLVCEGEEVTLGVSFAPQYPAGYVHCNGIPTAVVDVTNPTTGKTWMDRNLGANRAAISSTDAESYGSLFQWGRFADGHQCVNRYGGDGVTTSGNTALNATSSTDTPPHGDFILTNTGNFDWRSPQNNSLWQVVNGINNPCPAGYRLPTEMETNNERLTWVQSTINSTNSSLGAFTSPLKLPAAGFRSRSNGSLSNVGSSGYYWSSTVDNNSARNLYFDSFSANMFTNNRANGFSVRCIKNL